MKPADSAKPFNPILSCCEPLFALVAPLRDDARISQLHSDFREQILNQLATMEKRAFDLQIGMVELKDAKYAVTAFIDELVLNSSWADRQQWMAKPLQLEFFGEHTAGEGFFTRLATLRQGGEENVNLLELFYCCLQLGFEGVYRIKGVEHLMALQVDLRAQIDSYRGAVEHRLAAAGLPSHALINQVRRQVPYWVIAVITVAAVFFTYIGYSIVSNNVAEASISTINNYQKNILKSSAGGAE